MAARGRAGPEILRLDLTKVPEVPGELRLTLPRLEGRKEAGRPEGRQRLPEYLVLGPCYHLLVRVKGSKARRKVGVLARRGKGEEAMQRKVKLEFSEELAEQVLP
jgi:hypothetical protein